MERSKWMVFEDRKKIEKMYSAGKTVQEIAVEMKRNRATIYNELRKGDTGEMDKNGRPGYSAEVAQKYTYEVKQKRRGLAAVAGND